MESENDNRFVMSSPFHSSDVGTGSVTASSAPSRSTESGDRISRNRSLQSFGIEPDKNESFVGGRISRLTSIADNVPAPTGNSRNMTIFLLLNTMIGSGILNQPQVFEKAGVIGALVIFLFAAIFTWFGNVVLIICGLEAKVMGYPELVKHVLGDRGTIILNLMIVIGNIGAVMSYVALVGDTTSGLFQSWGISDDIANVYTCTVFMITVFVLPLCMYRHYGHLGNIAYLSIGCISLILLMVCIGGPIKAEPGNIRQINISGMLQKLGSVVFALSSSAASFLAYNSTKDATMPLWQDIMGDTNGEILNNFNSAWADPFKIMLIMHIILYIPGDFVVLRLSFVKLLQHGKPETPLETPHHALLSLSLLIVCTVLVMLLQATGMSNGNVFGTILDFAGGIAFSCISFVLPAWLYIVMHYNRFLTDTDGHTEGSMSSDDCRPFSSISSLTVSDFGSLWGKEKYKSHAAKDPYHFYCCLMLTFGIFTLIAVPTASVFSLVN